MEIEPTGTILTKSISDCKIGYKCENSIEVKNIGNDWEMYFNFLYNKIGRRKPYRYSKKIQFKHSLTYEEQNKLIALMIKDNKESVKIRLNDLIDDKFISSIISMFGFLDQGEFYNPSQLVKQAIIESYQKEIELLFKQKEERNAD